MYRSILTVAVLLVVAGVAQDDPWIPQDPKPPTVIDKFKDVPGWWMSEAGAAWAAFVVGGGLVLAQILIARKQNQIATRQANIAEEQNRIATEQNRITTAQNEIAVEQTKIQDVMRKLQRDLNDHQVSIDERQDIEAQGRLYIPLYLKVLATTRRWKAHLIDMDLYMIKAIEEAQQRGAAAGNPAFTDQDNDNVAAAAEASFLKTHMPFITALLDSLFAELESICYLISSGWVTDPRFLQKLDEEMEEWGKAYRKYILYKVCDYSNPYPEYFKLLERFENTGSLRDVNRTGKVGGSKS